MTDDEFSEAFNIVWKALNNGELSDPNTYIHFLKITLYFSKMQMLPIRESDIHAVFREKLESTHFAINEGFEFDRNNRLESKEPFATEIYNILHTKMEARRRELREKRLASSINAIHQGETEFFTIIRHGELCVVPVLNEEHAQLLKSVIEDASNSTLFELSQSLHSRYNASNISSWLSSEEIFLKNLLDIVKQETEKQIFSLRKEKLNALINIINSSLKNVHKEVNNNS